MLSTWRHSGFHVFCGNRIPPDEETAMENLARYIIYPDNLKVTRGHARAQAIITHHEKRRAGEVCLNCAQKYPLDG